MKIKQTAQGVDNSDSIAIVNRRILSQSFLLKKEELIKEITEALALFPIAAISGILRSYKVIINYNAQLTVVLLIFSVIFVMGSFISHEPETINRAEIWVWFCIFTGSLVYTMATSRVLKIFNNFCFNQFDEQSLVDFREIISKRYNFRIKFSVSLMFGIVFSIFLVPTFYIATGQLTPISYVSAFFVSIFIGSWLHGVYCIRLYTEFLHDREEHIEIFPINPAESVLIKKSANVIQIAAIAVVIILTVFIPLPLIVTGPTPTYQYTGLALIVGTLIVVGAIFFNGHSKLTDIVVTRKYLILDAIQDEIRVLLQTSKLTDENVTKRLDYLIALHDKISHTPDQTVNYRNFSQTFSSLILPTGTFLFGHIDTVKKILFP